MRCASFRLTSEDVATLDALIPSVSTLPAARASGRVTRSTVARLALRVGLEKLARDSARRERKAAV